MADSAFPRRGVGCQLQRDPPTYYLAIFSPRRCMKTGEIGARGGQIILNYFCDYLSRIWRCKLQGCIVNLLTGINLKGASALGNFFLCLQTSLYCLFRIR